jgi:DNA polymerase III psi subunit
MHPEVFNNTYEEELYIVSTKPVVVLDIEWDKIREGEKTLLEKILSSVKLSLNHVKVVCNSKPDVANWTDRPKHVLVFGSEIAGLSKNELLDVQGIKLIISSSLENLDKDSEAKKKLWNSLKLMFQA